MGNLRSIQLAKHNEEPIWLTAAKREEHHDIIIIIIVIIVIHLFIRSGQLSCTRALFPLIDILLFERREARKMDPLRRFSSCSGDNPNMIFGWSSLSHPPPGAMSCLPPSSCLSLSSRSEEESEWERDIGKLIVFDLILGPISFTSVSQSVSHLNLTPQHTLIRLGLPNFISFIPSSLSPPLNLLLLIHHVQSTHEIDTQHTLNLLSIN